MSFYMAEYLGSKPDEAFYQQNMKGYLEAIDLAKEKYSQDYFVAIKFTALIDHDSLCAANKFSFLIEDFFNHFYSSKDEQLGLSMTKKDFFKNFSTHFKIEVSEEELEELWSLVKTTEDKETLYFFEWRVNFSFINLTNPKVSTSSIYQKLNTLTGEEQLNIEQGLDRIKFIMSHAQKFKNEVQIIADAEQSYL